MRNGIKITLITSLVLGALSNTAYSKNNERRLDRMYDKAVEDANLVEPSEISNTLNPITPDNKKLVWNEDKTKLLVATWKSNTAYEKYIKPYSQTSNNEKYVTWVTAVPEVKEFCNDFVDSKEDVKEKRLNKRLKQLLGLKHTWDYDVFVEMWVSPEDMFRPCTDPEISDASCNLKFGDTIPTVKNIKDYGLFYKNLYYSSFRSSDSVVPWTGLGYTYDWANNKTDIGVSEYILVPNAAYEIHNVYNTQEYCNAS